MGVVPPADGFLAGLRDLCDRYGMLLIFDEVISGFRVSAGGAQQAWKVKPDLTCLGKIIGGGLPVGAYGGRADLMEHVSPAGPGVPGRHAVGQPARDGGRALVARRPVARSLQAAGERSAPRWPSAWPTRRARPGSRCRSTRVGSVLTPFFTSAPVRDYRSALQSNSMQYAAFFRGMLARGVYPPPSQFEAWFLSAAHTEADVKKTIRAAQRGDAGGGRAGLDNAHAPSNATKQMDRRTECRFLFVVLSYCVLRASLSCPTAS